MSLDSVELVIAIEEEFGVDIPEANLLKMFTVGDIYEWLKSHVDRPASGGVSDDDIWRRLVDVFVRQTNVNADEVKPRARIAEDLGID